MSEATHLTTDVLADLANMAAVQTVNECAGDIIAAIIVLSNAYAVLCRSAGMTEDHIREHIEALLSGTPDKAGI